MVFSIFSKKVDRPRIYRNVTRVEQHFQTLVATESPLQQLLQEFDLIHREVASSPSPEMIEPLLRFEEMAAGLSASHYVSRVCLRLRGARGVHRPEELMLYEQACIKHYEFLTEFVTLFYAALVARREQMAVALNRQFHWLCELVKIGCFFGDHAPQSCFEAARGLLQFGQEREIVNEEVAPYARLYIEERASLVRNLQRQYLLTAICSSDLPVTDVEIASILLRLLPLDDCGFSEQRRHDSTHYVARDAKGRESLRRVYPELEGSEALAWYSGLPLIEAIRNMAPTAKALLSESALGEMLAPHVSEKCLERVAAVLSPSATREAERRPVDTNAEVFTDILDCVCYLRRINEEFLVKLSDADEKRRFNVYEQFDAAHFGYVEGHVNQTLRSMAVESVARQLARRLDVEYAGRGVAPSIWHVEDVSASGYGLVVGRDARVPELGGIVILSPEDNAGIEFGVLRRVKQRDGGYALGIELLFAEYGADPLFVSRRSDARGQLGTGALSEPYGFLLTQSQDDGQVARLALLPKRDSYPNSCKIAIRTVDAALETQVDGVEAEGLNWIAYRLLPVPMLQEPA